jgi:acetyl-CoA C-acetyltransferase
MSTEAFIYDAIRTPRGRGKSSGTLHEVKPISLVAGLLRELEQRNNLEGRTQLVDDVVLGCVSAVGDQGADIAKVAALAAGWDEDVAGVTLNRFCASGAEAVNLAAMKIRSGWEQLVVGGGIESMSRVPMGSDGGAMGMDPETALQTGFMPQGIGADLIATMDGFSRTDIDDYAAGSHRKAAAAWARGAFSRSVIPVRDRNGITILERDETIRPDTSVESLAKLQPSFQFMGDLGFDGVPRAKYPQVERIEHVHTAGNSSGIVDGAALVLVGSEAAGRKLGLKPRGRVVATAVVGTDPTIMLVGPAPATRKALAVAGLSFDDIDLFEVNEAFAAVVMHFQRDTGVPFGKINVNGGAIAMGHPLGATGAMLIGTVLDELETRGGRYGVVTACVGGGMGIATIIERL